MGNEGSRDGNIFGIPIDQDIVKDWKDALETIDEVFEPTEEGKENISFERPDVEAIIATQPPIVKEEDPPVQKYTGICSTCNRPKRGLCPCNDINAKVETNPLSVNTDLGIKPFGMHELISG